MAAEFASLAGLLAAASDAQWDTPSMCEGWRVREVVAHMTMAARYSEEEFMAELRRCEFDFTRLSDEVASRDARLPVNELVANLRSECHAALDPARRRLPRRAQPRGDSRAGRDRAAGRVPLLPDETIRVVLDDLAAGGGHARFGVAIDGRHLQASDLDWSHGSGPVLRGAAGDLALALCGRAVPAGRLRGDPLPRS